MPEAFVLGNAPRRPDHGLAGRGVRRHLLGCVVGEPEGRGRRYGVAAVSGAAALGVLVERVAA